MQVVGIDDAAATALHLLEVGRGLHVTQEEHAFQRFDVGAGGDHVDRDSDAGIVGVAELGQQVLRFLAGGLGGDLLAEVVPLAELLTDDLHDVVGMQVGLGEDQRLRDFGPAGEDFGEQLSGRS